MEKDCECYEEEVQPYRKTDYKPIIYIYQIILTQSRHYLTSITTMLPLQHTHHLFYCTHIRTMLSPLDLWTDSAGVMELLARWRDKLAGNASKGSWPCLRPKTHIQHTHSQHLSTSTQATTNDKSTHSNRMR